MTTDFRVVRVDKEPQLDEIRRLFREYAKSLPFSLDFQGFEAELAALPGIYAPPQGRLFLGEVDGKAAGCIALKPLTQGICEMKRLYVRPEFRGKQVGRKLAGHLIAEAHKAGYRAMRLDTIADMKAAIALYESLGFKRIEAYYRNPIANACFLELKL
ncbi:MAG: GNAT family N-acetyltransferase [Planctomycetes bacterium]|nr:GNAT family N-acetyltransferase [Planctomycetota bacterium]